MLANYGVPMLLFSINTAWLHFILNLGCPQFAVLPHRTEPVLQNLYVGLHVCCIGVSMVRDLLTVFNRALAQAVCRLLMFKVPFDLN